MKSCIKLIIPFSTPLVKPVEDTYVMAAYDGAITGIHADHNALLADLELLALVKGSKIDAKFWFHQDREGSKEFVKWATKMGYHLADEPNIPFEVLAVFEGNIPSAIYIYNVSLKSKLGSYGKWLFRGLVSRLYPLQVLFTSCGPLDLPWDLPGTF